MWQMLPIVLAWDFSVVIVVYPAGEYKYQICDPAGGVVVFVGYCETEATGCVLVCDGKDDASALPLDNVRYVPME